MGTFVTPVAYGSANLAFKLLTSAGSVSKLRGYISHVDSVKWEPDAFRNKRVHTGGVCSLVVASEWGDEQVSVTGEYHF
jgi:hypothetical protein